MGTQIKEWRTRLEKGRESEFKMFIEGSKIKMKQEDDVVKYLTQEETDV